MDREGGRHTNRDVEQKLMNCWRQLIHWRMKKFGNNCVKLKKAKYKLRVISQKYSCAMVQREEELLKDRIKELWMCEEIYWKQWSRINWRKSDDRNSIYFHLTTSTRRRWNNIPRLMGKRVEWIKTKRGIIDEVREHFEMTFTSDHPKLKNGLLEGIPSQITI